MKCYLMNAEQDFSAPTELSTNDEVLIEDLGLEALFHSMAGGDSNILEVSRRALMTSLLEVAEVEFRQAALTDCLTNPEAIRVLYAIAIDAIQAPRKVWGYLSSSPSLVLSHSVKVLELLLGNLHDLRELSDECRMSFESDAFKRFFAMIGGELDDAYLEQVAGHLKQLEFKRGVKTSAHLGEGNKAFGYTLLRPSQKPHGLARIPALFGNPGYSFRLAPRDESGSRALGEIRDDGIAQVTVAAKQSTDHIISFFEALLTELGFYVGCLNLRDELERRGEPICIPSVTSIGEPVFRTKGLYDPGLALRSQTKLVGNRIDARGHPLVVITGANQGGKSTFLRSIGLAQLMMQAGMFVAAESFCSEMHDGLFTHFKREEDASMESGKLDEELARMSQIADELKPDSLILFNESFAATNEREGSEIARQITDALVGAGIKVVHVTHMYEFAHGLEHSSLDALFLRADREGGGRRTFRMIEGEPLSTSFGEDIYRQVFPAADDGGLLSAGVDGLSKGAPSSDSGVS